MLVPLVSTPNASTSRAVGTKRRKLGGWGRRALKCTLSRSSAWELSCDVPKENEGSRGLLQSWVVPLASAKEVTWSSTRSDEASGRTQATTHSGGTGARAHGCAATARRVARDPAARKAAQIKVRSKFYAKNVEAAKFSKLALAEELATLGGCEPGALDNAGYRSAPAYIAELRLRHVELDFAVSPALDRTFKKVNDAMTRGLGPAKKAPEVKLSAIQHTVDTSVVGAADAYVVSLHWLLRAHETENLLLGMASLVLHGSETDPGDVTLQVPTSKTDPRGNGASRRLTCICKLLAGVGDPTPDACPTCAVRRQVSRLRLLFGWVLDGDSETRPLFPRVDGSRASKAQLVEAWGEVTSQNEKPTGHSPRRSGAKRYARQGWSVWMIQFMGRWAASTVLGYIEEAMAEVTAC